MGGNEAEETQRQLIDDSRYTLALEVVTEWVEELVKTGHTEEEALRSLLLLLETGVLPAQNPMIEEHRAELEAVLKSRLGQTH